MGPGQCQCQQVSGHRTVFDFYKIFVTYGNADDGSRQPEMKAEATQPQQKGQRPTK